MAGTEKTPIDARSFVALQAKTPYVTAIAKRRGLCSSAPWNFLRRTDAQRNASVPKRSHEIDIFASGQVRRMNINALSFGRVPDIIKISLSLLKPTPFPMRFLKFHVNRVNGTFSDFLRRIYFFVAGAVKRETGEDLRIFI